MANTHEAGYLLKPFKRELLPIYMVLGEDKRTIHLGGGPHLVGALRNTVLNLLLGAGQHRIAASLRHNSRHPAAALALLGLSL